MAGRLARAGTAVGLIAVMSLPAGPANAETTPLPPGGVQVPVIARAVLSATAAEGLPRVVMLVHGLRRIPGGTVLYYSVGVPEGGTAVSFPNVQDEHRWIQGASGARANPAWLVDVPGREVYSTLVDDQQQGIASRISSWRAEPGVFHVLFQVFPAVPDDVTAVDIVVGEGVGIAQVPVSEGLMEPARGQDGPMLTGEAWPLIDTAAVAAADQAKSITPLLTEVASAGGSVTQREKGSTVSVDLSTEVLFAVDSATLSGAARQRIAAAAAEINSRAGSGAISVVGHTDNSGSTSYNLDLSRRRAAAVAAAIKPLITVPGASVQVQGRGESEPVADNGSEEGRKANRRVSVVFTAKG